MSLETKSGSGGLAAGGEPMDSGTIDPNSKLHLRLHSDRTLQVPLLTNTLPALLEVLNYLENNHLKPRVRLGPDGPRLILETLPDEIVGDDYVSVTSEEPDASRRDVGQGPVSNQTGRTGEVTEDVSATLVTPDSKNKDAGNQESIGDLIRFAKQELFDIIFGDQPYCRNDEGDRRLDRRLRASLSFAFPLAITGILQWRGDVGPEMMDVVKATAALSLVGNLINAALKASVIYFKDDVNKMTGEFFRNILIDWTVFGIPATVVSGLLSEPHISNAYYHLFRNGINAVEAGANVIYHAYSQAEPSIESMREKITEMVRSFSSKSKEEKEYIIGNIVFGLTAVAAVGVYFKYGWPALVKWFDSRFPRVTSSENSNGNQDANNL